MTKTSAKSLHDVWVIDQVGELCIPLLRLSLIQLELIDRGLVWARRSSNDKRTDHDQVKYLCPLCDGAGYLNVLIREKTKCFTKIGSKWVVNRIPLRPTRSVLPVKLQAPEGIEMSAEQQIALKVLTQVQMARVHIMLREVGRASHVGWSCKPCRLI
jgi:hypothetical protein